MNDIYRMVVSRNKEGNLCLGIYLPKMLYTKYRNEAPYILDISMFGGTSVYEIANLIKKHIASKGTNSQEELLIFQIIMGERVDLLVKEYRRALNQFIKEEEEFNEKLKNISLYITKV